MQSECNENAKSAVFEDCTFFALALLCLAKFWYWRTHPREEVNSTPHC